VAGSGTLGRAAQFVVIVLGNDDYPGVREGSANVACSGNAGGLGNVIGPLDAIEGAKDLWVSLAPLLFKTDPVS